MKIIQSYWSKPSASRVDGDVNARPKGGWNSPSYNLMSWTLSCLRLRQFYDEVELITDEEGKKLLIDSLKLPYTKVSTDLEELNERNVKLWSYGKLYSYALQDKPFIHVDGDFFIWKKFPRRITSARLLCQHLEKDYWLYRYCLDEMQKTFPAIPRKLIPKNKLLAANAGIIGGNDVQFFKDLYFEVKAFIKSNRQAIDDMNNGSINIILEQLFFYQLAMEQKKEIRFLFSRMSHDFSDCLRFNLVPHHSSFIHVIGEAKKNMMVCDQLRYTLKYEYPKYLKRIEKICGEEQKNGSVYHDFSKNQERWRAAGKNDVYNLKLKLSQTSSVAEKADEEYQLTFQCPMEHAVKTIPLQGIGGVIHLLNEPHSVNDILTQFDEYPTWSRSQLSKVRFELLNILTSYMFYLNALEIA